MHIVLLLCLCIMATFFALIILVGAVTEERVDLFGFGILCVLFAIGGWTWIYQASTLPLRVESKKEIRLLTLNDAQYIIDEDVEEMENANTLFGKIIQDDEKVMRYTYESGPYYSIYWGKINRYVLEKK